MFDIGFAELLLIGVVGLLVVGPEQLPGAVRTTLAWVNRFRRSFDQIRTEVRRELHNDEVMQKLKAESREFEKQVKETTSSLEREVHGLGNEVNAVNEVLESTARSVADPDTEADRSTQAHETQPTAEQDKERSSPT
jgi:sec-independent protein translocase protein TatB